MSRNVVARYCYDDDPASSPKTGLSNDDGRSLFALSVPRNSQMHQLVYFRFSWAGGSLETTLRVVSGSAKKGANSFPGVSTRHLTSSGAGNYRQKNCDDFAHFFGDADVARH